MKALVYQGEGKIEWKDVEKPGIEKPTDALVKVLKTTICGLERYAWVLFGRAVRLDEYQQRRLTTGMIATGHR
ncbi:MAG: hypothetical protein KF843_02110 [Flavobacteriales bacterium]|nr:hypothetical protein [Flavobacteriales bacterium]